MNARALIFKRICTLFDFNETMNFEIILFHVFSVVALYFALQKGIMEVLFEIFQLKEPEWTDDFHLALLSVGKRMKRHIFLRESVMNLVLIDLGLESC